MILFDISFPSLDKRVQAKSSTTRPESIELLDTVAFGSTNKISSTNVMPLPLNPSIVNDKQPKDPVQMTDNSNMREEIEPCIESDRSNISFSEAVF